MLLKPTPRLHLNAVVKLNFMYPHFTSVGGIHESTTCPGREWRQMASNGHTFLLQINGINFLCGILTPTDQQINLAWDNTVKISWGRGSISIKGLKLFFSLYLPYYRKFVIPLSILLYSYTPKQSKSKVLFDLLSALDRWVDAMEPRWLRRHTTGQNIIWLWKQVKWVTILDFFIIL